MTLSLRSAAPPRGRAPLAGALLAALASPLLAQGGQPTPVRVDAVRLEMVQEQRLVTGDVRPVRRSMVASREAGVVLELPVREGDLVEAGTELAQLDKQRLELDLGVLQAQAKSADAALKVQRALEQQRANDLEVLRRLSGQKATNPKELTDAESEYQAAAARAAQAEAEAAVIASRVAVLQQRIADTTVRAPYKGMVTRKTAEVGQWLAEGDGVIELVSVDELEAWLEVPQQEIATVRGSEEPLRLQIDATGEKLETSDYRAILDVAQRGRTFSLVAALPAQPSLAAGLSVTAWVPTSAKKEHLTVARDAILRNEAGPFLYVALGGGDNDAPKAVPMPVEVLFELHDRVVVRSDDLAPGMKVVVEGNERLFPMSAGRSTTEAGAHSRRRGGPQ